MARISLVEAYDNRSVIKQIYDLKQVADEAKGAADTAQENLGNALSVAQSASEVADSASQVANGLAGQVQTAQDTANAANTTASQAETNAGNAVFTANQAQSTANGFAAQIEGQNSKIDASVKQVGIETTATDGTINATTQNGTLLTAGIPVVSTEKAGLATAQMFNNLAELGVRVSGLEQADGHIWYVNFPNASPSQAEIGTAFTTAGGTTPTTGDIVLDLVKILKYVYVTDKWVKYEQSPVEKFSQGVLGTIKGALPSEDGKIIAETDGTGSVQGWSALKGRVLTAEGKITANETSINGLGERLTTAEATLATADGNATQALGDAATAQSTATYAKGVADGHTPLITALQADVAKTNMGVSTGILTTAGWTADGGQFKQELTVTGVTPTDIIWVGPINPADYNAMGKNSVCAVSQSAGKIMFKAMKKPSNDINVNIVRRPTQ